MAAGDIQQVKFVQSMDGDVIENQFFYKVDTDDGSGANEDPLALQFEIDVIPAWQPCVTADLSMDCLGTQRVFPIANKTAFRDLFITALGTAVGEAMPLVVTALIQKFEQDTSGRGKKGHTYISGIPEDQSVKGRIGSVLQSNLIALASKLTQNLITPGGGIYNPVWAIISPLVPHIITGFVDWTRSVVLPRVSHQSKRKTPIRKFA